MRWLVGAVVCCLVLVGGAVLAQGWRDFPNCVRYGVTNTNCCCTNNCCSAIQPSDIRHVEGDKYEILASGQVIARTDWSATGEIVRCACDPAGTGGWVKRDKSHTHCLFIPLPQGS